MKSFQLIPTRASLYFTYEELKPAKYGTSVSRLASLYFTYEELKHKKRSDTRPLSIVCILPMRN